MKYLSPFVLAVSAMLFSGSVFAQEYTSLEDLKKNDVDWRDYQIQGEYLYEAGGKMFALQVIADGDGKFTLVGYPGGFPGQGWLPGRYRIVFSGAVDGESVVLKPAYMEVGPEFKNEPIPEKQAGLVAKIDLEGKAVTFLTPGKPDRVAKKIARTSESLGKACPENGTQFYNGLDKDKTATDKLADFHKINEATGAMFAEFNTKAFEKGKKYYLHVEFLTSFMPRAQGQGRSNSGVYLNQCYECQVLDSFGLRGENNECGGIYQQLRPAFNACFPPLTWQTYDFLVTPPQYENGNKVSNAKVTVAHNGILIYDECELKDATPGCKPEADEARGIYLQGHGNNVQYRNIWVQYLD